MKGTTKDEVVEFHHQLNGYEFDQALGVGEEEGNLTCCTAWGSQRVNKIE